ncbi:MAG: GFA family protein [Sandaracinaceae bacterium]
MPITGQCFCGAVTYRVEARLTSARSCHCSRCRRAFGGAASAYALVEPGSFAWVEGEELLTSYVGKHGAGKQFCRRCGSMLTGVFKGEVHGVALGCVDGDPGVTIENHLFVGSKAAWDVLPEGVVGHHAFPPDW